MPPGTTVRPAVTFSPGLGAVFAGNHFPGGTQTPVDFQSTSAGTLEATDPERITSVPLATDVVVETAAYRLAFRYPDASTLQLIGFSPRD